MKVRREGIIVLLASMLMGAIIGYHISRIDGIDNLEIWNFQMSILIISILAVMILLMLQSGIPLFSFSVAFIFLASSFNCGQCLVNYLGIEILKHGNVFALFGEAVYKKVTVWSIWSIYLTYLGMICNQILLGKQRLTYRIKWFSFPNIDNDSLIYQKRITIALLSISLPAQLYITVKQITNNITYGYNVAALMTNNPLVNYASKLLVSAVVIALYQAVKRGKSGIGIYLAYLCLNLVTMIGGGVRSASFLAIVVVTYLFFFVIHEKRIRIKDVIIWGTLGIIALQILVAIRDMRAYGFSLDLFINAFSAGKKGAVGSYFSETTVTEGVLGYVISNESTLNQPVLGQLFSALLGIIPGIGYLSPIDLTQFDLQKVLNIRHMGGSFVADLYFDHVLVVGSFIWGAFVHRIFMHFEKEKNILKCAFWAPIITQILLSVRTTIAQLPRMIVWIGILYYTIIILFRSTAVYCPLSSSECDNERFC